MYDSASTANMSVYIRSQSAHFHAMRMIDGMNERLTGRSKYCLECEELTHSTEYVALLRKTEKNTISLSWRSEEVRTCAITFECCLFICRKEVLASNR